MNCIFSGRDEFPSIENRPTLEIERATTRTFFAVKFSGDVSWRPLTLFQVQKKCEKHDHTQNS